jgi:hypothetical protein
MRDRMLQVELSSKEILMVSQSMYLANVCMRNPHWFMDDQTGVLAIIELMKSETDWISMGKKMLLLCMNAETTKGC